MKRALLKWFGGVLVLSAIWQLAGPSVLEWWAIRSALYGESLEGREYHSHQRLECLADLGLPTRNHLMALLDDPRVEVRRSVVRTLKFRDYHDDPPKLDAFHNDPDPMLRTEALIASANWGDRDALLRLAASLRNAELDDEVYWYIGRVLAFARFREAGEDAVERLSTADDSHFSRLLDRLDMLFRHNPKVQTDYSTRLLRNSKFDAAQLRELRELSRKLTPLWGQHKIDYRSVTDFKSGERLYEPSLPPHSDIGVRLMRLWHAIIQATWLLGFWIVTFTLMTSRKENQDP